MSFCWLRDPADIALFWTVRRRGNTMVATGHITPGGLEFCLEWNGEPYFKRVFSEEEDVRAFARDKLVELESDGWTLERGGGDRRSGG